MELNAVLDLTSQEGIIDKMGLHVYSMKLPEIEEVSQLRRNLL